MSPLLLLPEFFFQPIAFNSVFLSTNLLVKLTILLT